MATLVGLMTVGTVNAQESIEPVHTQRGAVCITKVNNQLLMIREYITGKLSLPGGNIEAGELPGQAAQREMWEETGLVIDVVKQIGQTPTAYVFDCVSQSNVIALDTNNALGGKNLPIWGAPDFGIETLSGMLIDPKRVNARDYRYPEQWALMKNMFKHATDQPMRSVPDLIAIAPSFQQHELHFLVGFQHMLQSLPDWGVKLIGGAISLGNMLANPILALILFPLFIYFFGTRVMLKLLFTVAFVSLVCLLLQRGIALPRPYVYLPTLDPIMEAGYSMPCVVTAILTSCFFILWQEREHITSHQWMPALGIAIVWQIVAQFLSGDVFISDCLAGAILGMTITWNVYQLESRATVDFNEQLLSYKIWLALLVLSAMLTYLWSTPGFREWLAILAAVVVALGFGRPFDHKKTFFRALGSMGALVCCHLVFKLLLHHFSYSTTLSLWLSFLHYSTITLMVFLLTFRRISLHDIGFQIALLTKRKPSLP
ncbi:bifunctional NUDIX hydrolase/phosphatase PAP2 family protein [Vibrio zhugei]|nr:NUDIX domain-containing protein [Vibrio zhugei]